MSAVEGTRCDRCGVVHEHAAKVLPDGWHHLSIRTDAKAEDFDLCNQCTAGVWHFIKNPPPQAAQLRDSDFGR